MKIVNKNVTDIVIEAYQTAVEKGWHDEKVEFGTRIALIHSEVTEAVNETIEEKISEELADVAIRIFNLCGEYKFNIEKSLNEKHDQLELTLNLKGYFDLDELRNNLLDLHSLISKVLEEYRLPDKGNKDILLTDRLADIILFLLQIEIFFNLNIQQSILDKMEKNKLRPYKHGGKII